MTTKTPRPVNSCLVSSFQHRGRHYEQRLVNCGKSNCSHCNPTGQISRPSHGPYWYLCARRARRWRRIYLGKELDTEKFIDQQSNIDWAEVVGRRHKVVPGEGTTDVPPGQPDMVDDAAVGQPPPTPGHGHETSLQETTP